MAVYDYRFVKCTDECNCGCNQVGLFYESGPQYILGMFPPRETIFHVKCPKCKITGPSGKWVDALTGWNKKMRNNN